MQKTIDIPPSLEQWIPNAPTSKPGKGISLARFSGELLVIVFLAALAYIAWSANWVKFSRAEVFFAECAREMLATNNFITPLYHAQPFFDKPIFVYWLIIAMFKMVGISHFAARIPVIFASLITLFATAMAGSYLFGRRVGVLSTFMLASSSMFLSFSCLCMSDMFLVMFDTLSLSTSYAGIVSKTNRTLFWRLAAISMGFAFLTKGPVGIVLPGLATLIYLALTKKLAFIEAGHIVWGLIALIVVASPWFYAAYLANGPQSMIHFFIQENFQRFAGSTYDVHKPFWYTIASFFLGFAPWSVLAPFAFIWFCQNFNKIKKRLAGEVKVSADLKYENVRQKLSTFLSIDLLAALPVELSAELFLWIWVLVSVGFFCFSRGKCDYYTMPAFPAAAILVAYYINNSQTRYANAVKAIAISILFTTIALAFLVLPQVNKLLPVNKYAAMIKDGPPNLRVGVEETAASWIDEILFQSGKDPQRLSDNEQIAQFMSKRDPALVIIPEDKYNNLPAAQKRHFQVISSDAVATHPLTPGYLLERAGKIADRSPLVVAVNYKSDKE